MNLQTINTKGYTDAAKRLVKEVENLSIIPPKNGVDYSRSKHRFITGENSSVDLEEKTVNLVQLLANDPDLPYWQAFIMAGFAYASYFNEAGNVKRIKAHLTGMCNTRMTPKATAFLNYLKYGAAEELFVDAQWVLAESVNLYEECRREGMYTQAARLLENIATHVDVDAKVSNKVVIESSVDYAAILQQAEKRMIMVEEATTLESGPDHVYALE